MFADGTSGTVPPTYPGIYEAIVRNLDDPTNQGQARLQVPAVLGSAVSAWAQPVLGKDAAAATKVGDRAWVLFEQGDINRPTWLSTSTGAPALPEDILLGLHARLAASRRGPVVVAFLGSSTTEGVGATTPNDRWVNQLTRALQSAYPSGLTDWEPPTRTLAAAAASVPTVQGVHAVNGGAGGTFSNNYVSATAHTQLDTLSPKIVFHMIGSNDHSLGTAPDAYTAGLVNAISTIDSNTADVLHVLCDTFSRPDVVTPAYPWEAYLGAMAKIADSRANVVYLSQYEEWRAAGVGGYDPVDALRLTRWRTHTDIHPSDAGHSLLASMVAKSLRLPASRRAVRPEVVDRFQRTALASTETGQVWEAQTGVMAPAGGALKVTTGGTHVVTTGFSDCVVSALVTHDAAVVPGVVCKSNDSTTRIGAFLNGPSNRVELYVGTTITGWTTGVSLVGGQEYHLRLSVIGDQAKIELNGAIVLTATLAAGTVSAYAAYAKHGVRCAVTSANVKWRNFEVRAAA